MKTVEIHNSIMGDPERSRRMWHDVLKYMTMFRFYTDNLLSGEYGKLENKFREPIHDMADISVAGSLFVRDLSLLAKQELDHLDMGEALLSFSQALNRAIENMSPLVLVDEVHIDPSIRNMTTLLDEKYGPMLFENVLFVFADLYQFFECADKFTVGVTCVDGAVFLCEARFACAGSIPVPEDPFSRDHLFSDGELVWSRIALPVYVMNSIMRLVGGSARLRASSSGSIFCIELRSAE